jgi:hypothetical protein
VSVRPYSTGLQVLPSCVPHASVHGVGFPDIPLPCRGLQSLSGVSGGVAVCAIRMLNSHPENTVYNHKMPRIYTGADAGLLVIQASSALHYKNKQGKYRYV